MYLDKSEQIKEKWNILKIDYMKLLPTDLSQNAAVYIHPGEDIVDTQING